MSAAVLRPDPPSWRQRSLAATPKAATGLTKDTQGRLTHFQIAATTHRTAPAQVRRYARRDRWRVRLDFLAAGLALAASAALSFGFLAWAVPRAILWLWP